MPGLTNFYMKVVAMNSKIITEVGVRPLFAIVDDAGRTIIQVADQRLASKILKHLK